MLLSSKISFRKFLRIFIKFFQYPYFLRIWRIILQIIISLKLCFYKFTKIFTKISQNFPKIFPTFTFLKILENYPKDSNFFKILLLSSYKFFQKFLKIFLKFFQCLHFLRFWKIILKIVISLKLCLWVTKKLSKNFSEFS